MCITLLDCDEKGTDPLLDLELAAPHYWWRTTIYPCATLEWMLFLLNTLADARETAHWPLKEKKKKVCATWGAFGRVRFITWYKIAGNCTAALPPLCNMYRGRECFGVLSSKETDLHDVFKNIEKY